jgi:uncharacterized phiE125 gp8 family phage protein
MKRVIATPPVYYPIVLDQAKDHLNVDFSDNDKYIQTLISVATDKAEQFLRRRLITQTWKVYLDKWPFENYIVLPFGQLQSVTHVKYTDVDSTQTTWDTDEYGVDIYSDPGRIVLGYGYPWPSVSLHPQNPIEVQFVCGYGANTVKTITNATNASPIVITINTHGYTTGEEVYIYDVGGNTAANGQWIITKATDNTFSLNGSTGNAAYTSGGSCVKQSVPANIIHAIKLMLSDLYENRENILIGQTSMNLKTAYELLWPMRVHSKVAD